jgi:hypothetical protein
LPCRVSSAGRFPAGAHRRDWAGDRTLAGARDLRAWAAAHNVEIACTPSGASWLDRIEAQLTALRYFALDGTDHTSHKGQARMIRRYIIWRNNHAYDERLRRIVDRTSMA